MKFQTNYAINGIVLSSAYEAFLTFSDQTAFSPTALIDWKW